MVFLASLFFADLFESVENVKIERKRCVCACVYVCVCVCVGMCMCASVCVCAWLCPVSKIHSIPTRVFIHPFSQILGLKRGVSGVQFNPFYVHKKSSTFSNKKNSLEVRSECGFLNWSLDFDKLVEKKSYVTPPILWIAKSCMYPVQGPMLCRNLLLA